MENVKLRAMKDLSQEAIALENTLDTISKNIKTLEKSLTDSKTNFFFKKKVCREEVDGKEIEWFISWEVCSISKKYRLFLISEEKDTNIITFKKRFIECKLDLREEFAHDLISFMNSFRDTLKEYRLSLNMYK
jgi:hypothetical protein